MFIVGAVIGVLVLAGIGYTLIKYFQWWKRLGLPRFVYWILQTLLLGMLILCVSRINSIPSEFVRSIFLRVSAIYMVMLVYSTAMILLRQIVCLAGQKFRWKSKVYRVIHSTKKGIGGILIIAFLLGVVSLFNMQYMTKTEYQVNTGKLQQMEKPLTIAAITDAHIGTAVLRSDLKELVQKVNETKPDLIFLVGDMFDHSSSESLRQAAVKAFSGFVSTYGTYYVEGNHEVYLREDTAKYFREAGIHVLADQITTLPNGVQIVGRQDFADKDQLPLETLMEGIDQERPVILLSHQPLEFEKAAGLGTDLVISGHTHGGQLIGNIGTYLTNDMNYGLKKFGNMTAITSSGIGGWGVPAKLGFPSEIVVIEYQ